MSIEDVKKNLAALPWVRPLKGDVTCDGIKWSTIAMKDVGAALRGELPPGHRARCKKRAQFHFRATTRGRVSDTLAYSGRYCTTHAIRQVTDYGAENRRANAYWDKNGWWLNGVFGNHSEVV